MTTDRIKEIQDETAYPNSTSVQQALLKVWNECEQEQKLVKNCSIPNVSQQRELLLAYHRYLTEELSLDLHEIWVDEHLKANNCG